MMGFTRFFPLTREQRERTGDPRLSIAERYPSRDVYLTRVREEAMRLAAARYIVEEDIDVVVANAADRYDTALTVTPPP